MITRKYQVMLLIVLVVVAIGLIDYGYMYWRAAQGWCDQTGEKLSTEQRFKIALDSHLLNQQVDDLLEIGAIERKGGPPLEDLKRDFTVIAHGGREQFLAENPQCCRLTWSLPEGQKIGFWQKATDSGDGYFYFNHIIHYTDRDGTPKQITARRTYYQVTNCGHPRRKTY